MAGWNRCCRVGYFLFRWYSCGSAMVLFKSLVEGRLGLVTSHIAYCVYCIGIESVWLIQNITQYSSAYVRVFDRHKNLVFDQQGYKNNWDGKYQKSKKPLPAGPYYYIVQLNDGSAARSGWLYITY